MLTADVLGRVGPFAARAQAEHAAIIVAALKYSAGANDAHVSAHYVEIRGVSV